MSGKISQYTEALSVANDDFFDVSIDTGGGVYATRKVRKSNLGIGGNFADSDLTSTGNRTHDMAGNDMKFNLFSSTGQFILSSGQGGYGNFNFIPYSSSSSGVARIDNGLSYIQFRINYGAEVNKLSINKNLNASAPALGVKGTGSTSATTTALFENSAGTPSLRVDDAGSVWNARAGLSTSFGFEALLNETGGQNTAVGHQALKSATNGLRNVAVGYQALNGSTWAGSNTAVGHQAGLISTGENNVFIGRASGSVATVEDQVVCIGAVSGTGGIGDYSTSLGYSSAGAGQGSTAIGSQARTSVNYASIINCSRGIRTNSTSNSLEVYVDNVGTDPVFKVAQSSDSFYAGSGSFGFGTLTPDASSVADMVSTTKGFLPPRMTTTQKNAISTPATGLVVYDSTLNKLCVYTGASWETVTSA